MEPAEKRKKKDKGDDYIFTGKSREGQDITFLEKLKLNSFEPLDKITDR
jgi:DTW domain-containing protein YfiP